MPSGDVTTFENEFHEGGFNVGDHCTWYFAPGCPVQFSMKLLEFVPRVTLKLPGGTGMTAPVPARPSRTRKKWNGEGHGVTHQVIE